MGQVGRTLDIFRANRSPVEAVHVRVTYSELRRVKDVDVTKRLAKAGQLREQDFCLV
jgi:hypothetical protein